MSHMPLKILCQVSREMKSLHKKVSMLFNFLKNAIKACHASHVIENGLATSSLSNSWSRVKV